jgi:hypothetical protein
MQYLSGKGACSSLIHRGLTGFFNVYQLKDDNKDYTGLRKGGSGKENDL